MKNKIIIGIGLSLVFLFLLGIVLYNEIPRVTYKYDEIKEGYVIKKAYGDLKEVTISKQYKNKPIVSIAPKAFEGQTKLKKINFESESQIEEIGKLAFHDCVSLDEIILPNSVRIIGNNAFLNCKSLTNVSGLGVETLYGSSFFDCENLKRVEFSQNLKYIGDYAFYNTNLECLIIGKNTKCENHALDGVLKENILYV